MLTMRLILPLVSLALVGCATTGDLAGEVPRIWYDSSKTPDQLEECIALALGEVGPPSTIQGDGRRIMVWSETGITMWTITIYQTTPTRAEMRWDMPVMSGKWRDRFRNCA